jgi:hypothetical protein
MAGTGCDSDGDDDFEQLVGDVLALRAGAKTTSQFRVLSSPGPDGVVATGLSVVRVDR